MSPTLLAPHLVLAPVAGSVQRVGRRLAPVDRPELVERGKELATVPGLTDEEGGKAEGAREMNQYIHLATYAR